MAYYLPWLANGSSGGFSDVPLPSGSLGFTVTWEPITGVDGYIVYAATATQLYPDSSLYAYQYVVTGAGSSSKVVTGVASGTKYIRVAAYTGTTVGELSFEQTYTPA